MSTLDRIDAIVAEATDAIAQATDTTALEDARIRYLGRKAELPNLLRGVAELPAGGALGHRQGRERGPQSSSRWRSSAGSRRWRRQSCNSVSRATGSTSRSPATRFPRSGACT